MLDKIEDALDIANIQYERLDGTMKRDDRTKAIEALKHNPACEVLLVSLRAGGVGLNLTSANRIIKYGLSIVSCLYVLNILIA